MYCYMNRTPWNINTACDAYTMLTYITVRLEQHYTNMAQLPLASEQKMGWSGEVDGVDTRAPAVPISQKLLLQYISQNAYSCSSTPGHQFSENYQEKFAKCFRRDSRGNLWSKLDLPHTGAKLHTGPAKTIFPSILLHLFA